ncbi:MAG: hypothetical protein ACREL1_07235, partial [bacterium]
KNTPYLEPLALLLANLSIIIAAFFFRKVIGRYTNEIWIINAATLIVFLGTPIWAYGRMLFTEAFLISFSLTAYWIAIEKKSGFWPGVLLSLGMFMKPSFAFLFFQLYALLLAKKKWGNIFRMSIGPALVSLFYFYFNNKIFGSPFHFSQCFSLGKTTLLGTAASGVDVYPLGITGIWKIWISWNHGIITFLPIVVPVLFSWKRFFEEKTNEAWIWGGGFVCYYLFMTSCVPWEGGWCYGPRQIMPVITFLMIPVFYNLKSFSNSKRWVQWVFIVLCLLSICFNALGAMDGYWVSHPLTILKGNVS